MKYALIITGVLAGLAIMAPGLVILGYFLLIVPGLVLTIAPTVFVYLSVTAAVRRLLPFSSPMASTTVALGIALLLGWAVMQPFRINAIAAYHASELPDVLPGQAIELSGHVRIERPHERRDPACDYLSLAVLDSPGVESRMENGVQSLTTVTAGRGKLSDPLRIAAYALVSANTDPAAGIFPTMPGQIVREYPPLIQASRGMNVIAAAKAVEANWAVRLAGQERLRKVDPIDADVADWIIRIDSQSNDRTSTIRRITIFDSQGTVRFRKSYRKQSVPARMFYFGFHNRSFSSGAFHVGRQVMESGQRSLEPEAELLQAIKFRVPRCDTEARERLRDQAIQALDDPAATIVRIDLARRYLGLFFFDTKVGDHALIARIVADGRVRDIDTQLKNVFSKAKTPAAMRDAYVNRIGMDHTSASLRHWLAERLADFPRGTFGDPGPAYLAIWDSPEIYQEAAPLIATLADLGPDHAMPMINEILDAALELPHYRDRRLLIDGIREAFVRLGPQASAAAPRIRELFLRRPSPMMNSGGEADQWRFALARMGVAIEELPFFPSQSPQSVQRDLRQVAEKIQRFEAENAPEEES